MAVPVEIQFALFLKILIFDREFKERVGDKIVIGIVYQGKFRGSLKAKDELINVMSKSAIKKIADIPIRHVPIDIGKIDLENAISKNEVDVLYVTPMRLLKMEKITNLSRAKKIRTLTGVPDYVESGLAVAIGIKGGKPRIIINLPAAKAEGANFAAGLLKLAKVIGK